MKIKQFYSKPSDLAYVKRILQLKCTEIDFQEESYQELDLAVVEALSNVDKYGGGKAELTFEDWKIRGKTVGISIVIKDFGPGIENFEIAEVDGYSNGNSLGIGLGAIKRLSDELVFSNTTENSALRGTQILLRKRRDSHKTNFSKNLGQTTLDNWNITGEIIRNESTKRSELYWINRDYLMVALILEKVRDNLSQFDFNQVKSKLDLKVDNKSLITEIEKLIPNNHNYSVIIGNKFTNEISYHNKGNFQVSIIFGNKDVENFHVELPKNFDDPKNLTFTPLQPFTLVCHSKGISIDWINNSDLKINRQNSIFEFKRALTTHYGKPHREISIVILSNW